MSPKQILILAAAVVGGLAVAGVLAATRTPKIPTVFTDEQGQRIEILDSKHYKVDCNTCTVMPGTHYAECTLLACGGHGK